MAATPEAIGRVHAAFGGHYLFTTTTTIAAIRWPAIANADLILCNLQFDEGKMFDLLRHAKSDPNMKSIPFLCLNSTDALSPALIQSVEIASKAVGADAFVNIYAWRRQFGDAEAYRRLRAVMYDLLQNADQSHTKAHQHSLEIF